MQFRFNGFHFAIAYFGHLPIVRGSFGLFGLDFELFQMLFALLDLLHPFFFGLPAFAQDPGFLFDFFEIHIQGLDLVLVVFPQHGLFFDFQLHEFAVQFVQGFGHGIDLNAQSGGGFVDQVDGLVRQKTMGEVTLR